MLSVKVWRVGPLARRLILLLAVGAIVPLGVAMTLTVVSADRSQKAEIVRRQAEIAKSTAQTISNLVDTPSAQLTLLANAGDFSSTEGRRAAVTDLFQANEGIDRVSIVGSDGRESARVDRYEVYGDGVLEDVSESPMFRSTQSGETYVGDVSFSRFNEPVVTIGVPLLDPQRRARGALAARLNLKVMWDVLAQTDAGATSYAYVVDSEGRLIGHRDPSLVLGGFDPLNSETVSHWFARKDRETQTGEAEHVLAGLNGESAIFDHAPVGDTGWFAFVETPTREAFAGTRASIMRAIVIVALSLLGAVIFAVIVGKRFVKPILQLTETTSQISEDDLTIPIAVKGTDEVGRLADSFRFMVDRLKGAFGTLEDTVSELRQRESDLRTLNESLEERVAERTQALARSNEELAQFAYVASHDLQEPLRMVTSYTQLLAKRYQGKLDSDADEFIEFAVDGASRMQGLINDLLEYSRIGSRGKEYEPTDCEVVFQDVSNNLKVAIEESGATVTHDPLPMIVADGSQLSRLFQNLIGNAIKYRRDRTPEVHVSAQCKDGEVLFCVRDNGIGIAPVDVERVFVIFQRLHTREEYTGTGIGLAVCRKIVERHGGRIWVESNLGEGSTFYFTIQARSDFECLDGAGAMIGSDFCCRKSSHRGCPKP